MEVLSLTSSAAQYHSREFDRIPAFRIGVGVGSLVYLNPILEPQQRRYKRNYGANYSSE